MVVLLPDGHPPVGLWHVVTAWPAGRGLQAALSPLLMKRRWGVMASPDRELKDKIAAEAEHAEASRDADLPYRRRRPSRSSVYGLRLPDERIDQLRRLAEAQGCGAERAGAAVGHRAPGGCQPRP